MKREGEASLLRRKRERSLEHGYGVLLPSRRRERGRSSKKMSMVRGSLSMFSKEEKRALYIGIVELA